MPNPEQTPGAAPENPGQPGDGGAAALLRGTVVVVNVGLASFAEDLEAHGQVVTRVDWSPPAGGDPEMAALLARLGA